MGRPRKTLLELVEDGTFAGRKDWELLDSDDEPPLRWKSLEAVRQKFRDASNEFDRQRYRLEFEKAIPKLHARRARQVKPLEDVLAELGPPGSAQRVKRFFPRFLRWDDGSPFRLDPYQNLIIDEGWRRDEHGRRIYKEIGCGIPRGNGKTPFWSGIGLEATLEAGRPKIFQTSGAGHQAELGLAYASDWIVDSPELRQWLRPSATKIRRRDGRGEYAILKASGSLGHGRKPNIGLVDEKWTIEQPNQEKTVTALETAIFKVPDAFWAWISTAGYSKETLLGEAFNAALKYPHVEHRNEGFHIRAWDEEAGQLFLWWGLPEGYRLDLENDEAMLKVIRLANPATWVDHRELLRALKRAMAKSDHLVNEWIRFNLNGWTTAKDAWLPAGLWWAMRSAAAFPADKVWEADPEIPYGSTIYIAVDAAKKRDTTACVWAYRLPNGRIALRSRVWAARDDVPHDVFVPGGRIRNSLVEDFIVHELRSRYEVAEVVYDPRYFDTQGENLADAGLRVAEFDQASKQMVEAVQHFYEAAIEKKIRHSGDPTLAAHVEGAAAVLQESGWKVFKLKSGPIDALTAAMMARERCQRAWEERKKNRSVYEKRDLRIVEVAIPDEFDDDLEDEASLIRAARALARAQLAAKLVGALVNVAAPVPWDELDQLEAEAVEKALAAAAAGFVTAGQDVRATLCLEELRRRPDSPTDEDE